jgi:ATP-binding cassette subfamily F protein 3
VAVLSGGEKTRLAIARMLVRPAGFLLLDEPTNHLDIPSREILTDALEAYRGTICFITHDRTLIREVADKIIEVREGRIKVFPGTYDDYLYRTETMDKEIQVPETLRAVRQNAQPPSAARDNQRQRRVAEGNLRNEYNRQSTPVKRRIAAIEREVARQSARLKQVEALLADPEHYKEGEKVADTAREYKTLHGSTKSLTGEWDRLTAEADRLTREFEGAMGELK